MKKILLAALATVALASPTFSADLPAQPYTKAPVAVPVTTYNWTGCYVGGNGGYAWNRGGSSYRDTNTAADPINGIPGPTGIGFVTAVFIPAPTSTGSSGWIGGGEVGCNWQMNSRIVLGFEADIDALHASGSASSIGPATLNGGPTAYFVGPAPFFQDGSIPGVAQEQVSLSWLSTIRARAGLPVLAEDRGLLFVTGGLAIGRVSSSGYVAVGQTLNAPYDQVWAGSSSSTLVGYALGGGFEYALTDHWTTKVEYLYYNLGNASHPLNLVYNSVAGAPVIVFPTLGKTVASVNGSIIRLGLNYRFNLGPVVARY
jgi:outer membrane immunogenic protein